jgi:hypothetical protein
VHSLRQPESNVNHRKSRIKYVWDREYPQEHGLMDAQTALVIAGLSYAGKEAAGVLAKVVAEVLTPSAQAIGDGFAANFRVWAKRRNDRALATLSEAAEIVEASGLIVHEVPGRVLWPLLEKSSLEEDQALRRLWARLLATAATSEEGGVTPAFVHILSQLTPLEATILDRATKHIELPLQGYQRVYFTQLFEEVGIEHPQDELILDNLFRLRILEISDPVLNTEDVARALSSGWRTHINIREEHPGMPRLTTLGAAFLTACVKPAANQTNAEA